MIEEDHKFLSQKEREVMPEHLSIEILRRGAKKNLMTKEKVFVIEVYTNNLGNGLVFQVFEEFIEVFRIFHLTLNRKLHLSLNNLKLFEISFAFFFFFFFFLFF